MLTEIILRLPLAYLLMAAFVLTLTAFLPIMYLESGWKGVSHNKFLEDLNKLAGQHFRFKLLRAYFRAFTWVWGEALIYRDLGIDLAKRVLRKLWYKDRDVSYQNRFTLGKLAIDVLKFALVMGMLHVVGAVVYSAVYVLVYAILGVGIVGSLIAFGPGGVAGSLLTLYILEKFHHAGGGGHGKSGGDHDKHGGDNNHGHGHGGSHAGHAAHAHAAAGGHGHGKSHGKSKGKKGGGDHH